MSVIALSHSNFEETILKHPVVVVDFWAKWCAPCHAFASVFEEVAKKNTDVIFAKVDIEAELELAETFHIRSVPSIMIFRGDVVVYADSGVLPASALEDLVQQAKTLDMQDVKKAELP